MVYTNKFLVVTTLGTYVLHYKRTTTGIYSDLIVFSFNLNDNVFGYECDYGSKRLKKFLDLFFSVQQKNEYDINELKLKLEQGAFFTTNKIDFIKAYDTEH